MFEDFVGCLPEEVESSAKALQSIYKDEVFAWAIATAIRDFSFTTRGEWNGEEHRTSTIMGFLGASMGFFGLLGKLSGMKTDGKLLWHASNKRSSRHGGRGESETGIDFGVAIPAPSEGNVRVSCFQAKNIGKDGRVDLNRPPKVAETAEGRMAAILADTRLAKWATGSPKFSENDFDATKPNHQMFKMAILQRAGVRRAVVGQGGGDANWVHYVLWRPDGSPIQFPLDSLVGNHQELNGKTIPVILDTLCKPNLSSTPIVQFEEHLINGLLDDHPGWLELPLTEARGLLGGVPGYGQK